MECPAASAILSILYSGFGSKNLHNAYNSAFNKSFPQGMPLSSSHLKAVEENVPGITKKQLWV
jgi:hypothetical protein